MFKFITKDKKIFILYLFCVPLLAITSVLFANSLQPLTNIVIGYKWNSFVRVSLFVLLFCLLDNLALYCHRIVTEKLRYKFSMNLKRELFNSILDKDIANYNSTNTSHYINILTRDINVISYNYFNSICGIFNVIVSFSITLIAIICINPVIAVINLMLGIFSVLIPRFFEKRLIEKQNACSDDSEEYIMYLKDYLAGFNTIKIFNIKNLIKQKMDKINVKQEKDIYKYSTFTFFVTWLSMACNSLSFVFTLIISVGLVLKGQITIGSIVALSQLIGGIVAPFDELPSHITVLKSISSIKLKLLDILNTNNSAIQKPELPDKNINNFNITLKEITLKYEDYIALNNINLKLDSSKKIVLIGESGSGKSSIANVIMGFSKCLNGNILIGNTKFDEFSEKQYYSMISYMQQDTFIFTDTIYNNITLYQEYDKNLVFSIIEKVGLSEKLSSLESGIYTEITESGSNLSGGEKQRIGLARALLKGAKFIILDEFTANMDVILESKIQETILNLDVGTLIITHRLNKRLLANCDGIIVLKDGNIIESGTFDQLLSNKDYFYSLYKINNSNESYQ